MAAIHLLVGEGAVGVAVAQPESLAAEAFSHLLAFIAINQLDVLEQGLACLTHHLNQLGRFGSVGYDHRQIPLGGRHRGEGAETGLETSLAGC